MSATATTPTFYQFAIGNVARHLKSPENLAKINGEDINEAGMNAFAASEVLAIVFCKNKEEIMQDIINHKD